MHRRCKSLIGVLCCSLICANTPMVFAGSSNGVASVSNVKEVKVGDTLLSAPVVATIATIAVGAGITLTTDDDIYDIARLVYDNYQGDKGDIENIFNSSVSIGADGVVKVGKGFLDICKNAFDDVVHSSSNGVIKRTYGLSHSSIGSIMTKEEYDSISAIPVDLSPTYNQGDFVEYNPYFKLKYVSSYTSGGQKHNRFYLCMDNVQLGQYFGLNSAFNKFKLYIYNNTVWIAYTNSTVSYYSYNTNVSVSSIPADYSIPYVPGSYDWGNINSNLNDDESVSIYVPSNASNLVGQLGGSTIKDGLNTPLYDLIVDGVVEMPTVSNPSISVDTSSTFPLPGGNYKTPVTLNQEATILDVVVPLSFPVNVDNKGVVTVADNVEVVNNSIGPIKISDISIQSKDDWALSDFDKDYSAERVGLKEFSFKIEGQEISDSITLNKVVNGLDKCSIDYDSRVAPQKDSISDSNIADIVLTINWYEN